MGYEMTRPVQKWLGIGSVIIAFFLMLFTLAVPYVNHFGEEGSRFTYFTKWNGNWRKGNMSFFNRAEDLLNFPSSASILIGIGLLVAISGAGYLFWLSNQNKNCYFTRERPGPMGGIFTLVGITFYIIGSLIYEKWVAGTPRPLDGWPVDKDFLVDTVRMSPTYWIGMVLAFIVFAFAVLNIIYYFDTKSKRPVK